MTPETEQASIAIIYDGMCHLCSRSMQWIAKRVTPERVRFVPAQSREGATALKGAGLDVLNPQSFLVVANGLAFQKTQAIMIILKAIGGMWKVAAWLLGMLPRVLTDKLYDWVAANRYKWFGRRKTCFIR